MMPSTCFALRAPTMAPVTAGFRYFELLHTRVRAADPAAIAFLLQFRHGCPALRSLGQITDRPVDLIEIGCIHLQPAQTGLAFASNGFRAQRVADLAFLVPDHPAFGENIR